MVLLCLCLPAAGQRLSVDQLGEEDGLPSSQILGLAQDLSGRLWVLTRGGLASFDGRTFAVHDLLADVPTRELAVLTQDAAGTVWAVTGSQPLRLLRFDGTTWSATPLPDDLVTGEGEEVTALAVALRTGVHQIALGTSEGLYLRSEGTWSRVEGGSEASVAILSLVAHGDVIYAASNVGLWRILEGRLDPSLGEAWPLLRTPVRGLGLSVSRDRTEQLWVVGDDWLGDLDLASGRFEVVRRGLVLPRSVDLEESRVRVGTDAEGGLYYGNRLEGWLLDENRGQRIRIAPANGFLGQGISALLVDRERNVWIGSQRGLSRIADRRFLSFGREQGLAEEEVSALLELPSGGLLMGHNRNLTLFEDGVARAIALPGSNGQLLGQARVMEFARSDRGEVVFAAVANGVGELVDSSTVRFYGAAAGVRGEVLSVAFDPSGRLWVAAGQDGVFVREGRRFVSLDLEGRWPDFVRRVVTLPTGEVYLGTKEGVFWTDGTGWRQAFASEGGAAENDVYAIYQDQAQRTLVGTAAGLRRIEGDRLVPVDLGDEGLDRPIFLILEDARGVLWLGTDDGVFLWDGDQLRQRTVRHGLAGRETNRGAGLVDRAGQVWVGTDGGVSMYQPPVGGPRPAIPPTAEIRRVEAGGEEHLFDRRIELPPGDNDLFFHVSGVSLSREPRLVMKYLLEGYDEHWLGPEPLTTAPIRYTNLPSGSYRFHFRVGRPEGVWSANRSTASIVVAEPFWQKPWVQGLALLLLASVAMAIYRFDIAKRRAALHDPLTGLPNRVLFTQRLKAALERKGRAGEPGFAVLFLDLDRFKNINDSLGHAAGDQLLVEIARRLSGCVQSGDTVSRLGGDEFTVLLEGIRRGEDVGSVAQRLQRAFEAPFRLRGHDVFAAASMGIALGSPQYKRPEEVLRDADTAMYRAKEHGGGRYEFFDPSMHEKAVVMLRLETDLRRALERGQLRLYYQPVVRLDSGEQVGCEALLRWQHPERGLLAPQAFLDVAEETGLILPIGEWVLREACAQLAAWRRAGALPDRFTLAVNVSPKQLARPDLAERIAQILRVAGWSGMDLTLEITESSLMSGPDSLKWLLKRCRDIGVSFAIDDFGTGHSSLSYLQNFPVQALKIDRGFVARMGTNPASVEIVRTIVDLGRNLGLEVVAEGVETARQAAYLRAIGCNLAQGYLFSGPIPAANLIQYITVPKAI